jgi:phenylpyruvate tautomerase PptA (4-oxalocrotonate tautomerase family)
MPIVDVELVVADNEQVPSNLATTLADAAGKLFGTSAGQTWVRLHRLPLQDYAENELGPPPGIRPIFVTVLKAKVPPLNELKRELEQLAEMIGHICGRPIENVHIFYQPEGRGRVGFGGRLVE